MEGALEIVSDLGDAPVSANHLPVLEDKVLGSEADNISTDLGNPTVEIGNVPSSTDIHEEINRKLEELESLGNTGELTKVNESFASESSATMSFLSESGVFLENEPQATVETSNVSSTHELLEDNSQSEAIVNEANKENFESHNSQEGVASEPISKQVELEDEQVQVKVSPKKEVESNVTETVVSGEHVDNTETLTVSDKPSELTSKEVQESEVNPVIEVENKIKDIIGEETNDAVTKQEISAEATDTEPVVSEANEDAPLTQSTEEIEISEIQSTEVVEADGLPAEFTVVDEASSENQVVTVVQEFQAEVDANQGAASSSETKNAVPAEQIVFVEEISSAEENSNIDNSQQAVDNELFVVTHDPEPETDPLQTPKEKPKKPRGRRPITTIPSHVLGVDINNPSADAAINGGGRPAPKPRLGVKVPYRNLSSQIVSKQEIEEEIMERFRQKQAQQTAERSDLMFARKLTQRLASKIAPSDIKTTKPNVNILSATKTQQSSSSVVKLPPSSARIEKDSDLLAILEGDDDDMYNEEVAKKDREAAERKVKQLEREIALKQLKDLPSTPPTIKTKAKTETKVKTDVASSNPVYNKPAGSSSGSNHATSPNKMKTKEFTSHSTKKATADVEPRLKANMVLKTYSRKRKSTDIESFISPKKASVTSNENSEKKSNNIDLNPGKQAPSVDHKKEKKAQTPVDGKADKKSNIGESKSEVVTPANAYVTKSSRIIKRKVIWDPDEVVTPRSVKSPKPGDTPGTSKQTTPVAKPTEKKVLMEKVDKPEKKMPLEKKVIEKKTPISSEKKIPQKKVMSPKKGKRLTEIDRLLMDEGAVNMLYEVKNVEDEQTKLKKKAKTVISLERAEKELRNKASELLKDLKQNSLTADESPKSLRRKDSPPILKKEVLMPGGITRKKSKDSTRSSVHSPPASPAFPYEASRIIRRHSSSSFSSGDEAASDKDGSERVSKRKAHASGDGPKPKKVKKSMELKLTQKTKMSRDMSKNFNAPKDVASKNVVPKDVAPKDVAPKDVAPKVKEQVKEAKAISVTKMFTLKRNDKVLTIKLNYGENEPLFNSQVLKELTTTLNRLANDSNCNGVVITSTGSAYCLGLDYKGLIDSNVEARKKKATELATNVTDFLKCLLHFPKVLVGGVQGDCVGIGVTMLSLFDMVIASDKAQFSMPYGALGCAPEAAFLLTLPHISSHGLTSELFYTSSKLSASEVSRHGLITRLCWPEKYPDELKTINLNISQQSRQTIEAAKKQLRSGYIQSTEAAITSQVKVLVEHWISDECQRNFEVKMETD